MNWLMRAVVITVLILIAYFLRERAVVNVVGGMPLSFDMSDQLIWPHSLVRQEFS